MSFKLERRGEKVIARTPCPGCQAEDFWNIPLDEIKEVAGIPTKCKECDRSFAIMMSEIGVEIVQTGGPELPAAYYEYYRRMS